MASTMDANWTGPLGNILADPPKPLVSDRIQLSLLLVMFCVGAPVNLVAFTRLLRRRSSGRNGRMTLLKLHLNVADLMVLLVYVTATVCWQITYEWRGGDVLCRVVKFLSSTSFQASSNLIVCVSLDRLFTVLSGGQCYKNLFKRSIVWYVRVCLAVAWVSAVIINLPQLFVWRLYTPYARAKRDWRQCTTVYAIHAHKKRQIVDNRLIQGNDSFPDQHGPIWRPLVSQLTYDLSHVLLVFWIPAFLIILSYSLVLILLYRLEVNRRRSLESESEAGREIDKAGLTFPLNQGWWRRRSSDNTARRCSANKEMALSTLSTGDRNAIEYRKESQSTTTSSHVYLVPIEISRVRNSTFRVSFLLVLAYLFFWSPYNVLALWQFVDDTSFKRRVNGIRFLNTLIVLNSIVNPFLYGAVRIWRRK